MYGGRAVQSKSHEGNTGEKKTRHMRILLARVASHKRPHEAAVPLDWTRQCEQRLNRYVEAARRTGAALTLAFAGAAH